MSSFDPRSIPVRHAGRDLLPIHELRDRKSGPDSANLTGHAPQDMLPPPREPAQGTSAQRDSESTSPPVTLPKITPPIDIYETEEGLILEADLPGASEEGLSVWLEDNVLHLQASVEFTLPRGVRPIRLEYLPGNFERSFILGDDVDRDQIRAELFDGMLRLTLPRSERARTRWIEVTGRNSDP